MRPDGHTRGPPAFQAGGLYFYASGGDIFAEKKEKDVSGYDVEKFHFRDWFCCGCAGGGRGFAVAVPGVAIGPSTEAAALEAGFSQTAVDDLKAAPEAIVSGSWVFLPDPICQIELPQVVSAISMDDPEVLAATSDPDAYAQYGDPGCFLDSGKLRNLLSVWRERDQEQVFQEYMGFVAAGLLNGELRFYLDDPLRTPSGFQVLLGDCAEVTGTDAMTENHSFLTDLFVPFLQVGKSCGLRRGGCF